MSIKTQTYIELLKICLQDEPKVTDKLINLSNGHIDWIDLLDFAARQGVIGVYWRGIELIFKSPTPLNKPTDDEVMEWWGEVNDIKKRNEDLFKKTAFVSNTFRKEGFENCILKGQGNAMMYPDPYLRTPGDIDIWLKGDRVEITSYINKMFPNEKGGKLHIAFPIFKDTLVEVHYIPNTLANPFAFYYLKGFYKDNQEKQMSNFISLPNGRSITFPLPYFNIIHQLGHIMGHYLYEGISLKQLVDYFYVMKKFHYWNKTNEDSYRSFDIIQILKRTGLNKFAKVIMYIMLEEFGINPDYLYTTEDKKGGVLVFNSIVDEINPHSYTLHNMQNLSLYNSISERQKLKAYRTFTLFPYFPGETIWGLWGRFKNVISNS